MKKKIAILVVLLIIGVVFASVIFSKTKNNYVFETVGTKNLTGIVSESGSLVSSSGSFVYSSTDGLVEKILVSNGDLVTEKQKLFSVKSTATQQEKSEALAFYQTAKSAVQQAENNRRITESTVNRVRDDLKNKDKTETFLEKETRTTAEVTNDNAYDNLLSTQANLKSAQVKYLSTQNSTEMAPVGGTIYNLSVAPGSRVSVSTPILFIKGLGPIEIIISVGENDINKIKVGQKTNIKFDAIENKIYQGEVARFDQIGTLVQSVPKYNLYITLLNPDESLKSGMTADVDIITEELTDVVAVPNAAVKPYQKGRAVRILKNGKIEYLPVKIGIRGKEYTQIIEGLSVGQQIIVSLVSEQTTKASLFKF